MNLNERIDRDTIDPAEWGEALYDAIMHDPKGMVDAEALTGWFATAIEAGRRNPHPKGLGSITHQHGETA